MAFGCCSWPAHRGRPDARLRRTTLEAYDRALKADKALAAQQLATAAGILTDNLTPPLKGGVAPPGNDRPPVQLIVVSSATVPGSRDIPVEEIEGTVIEGESRPA